MNATKLIEEYFHHFNAGEVRRATDAWVEHLAKGGKVMLTLSGAMSTARMGRVITPLIKAGAVHAITCTGANLEEDVFNALEGHRYIHVDWRSLSAKQEAQLVARGLNRVTDVCIPEDVMRDVWSGLLASWQRAEVEGVSASPVQHMASIILAAGEWPGSPQAPRLNESWVYAALKNGVAVYTPGWSDSTTGNMFSASVRKGQLSGHTSVTPDTAQFSDLAEWYEANCGDLGVGFFQIGGGIAGDWPICVVPSLRQDENKPVPHWAFFVQICDAPASYGGYSGAPPNEKITWDKLGVDTPRFSIQSDATIVFPLIAQSVLERTST